MEQNLDIVREMYELGRSDALNLLEKIRSYIKSV